MISVSKRKWKEVKVNLKLVEKVQQDYKFSKIISKLIVSRDFDEYEIHLINNNLKLHNIFQKNLDFINSVELVEKTIKKGEKICILGDYDVDGSAATSLFNLFLKELKYPHFYYIPDRFKDGYGASKKLFKKLILENPKLIIMVDCGSTSEEAIDFLNENNIKSLIIDHHEIDKPYPKANFIINPKKNNGYIEYDYLCATSLTYFFLDMLSKKIKCKINLSKYLIYVLLASVCDVMPLRKLNRLITNVALDKFKISDNMVINELCKLNNKKDKININDLGFLIGPILNSGGRLGKSMYATELLSCKDNKIINKKSLELINLNNKRKVIEDNILKDINFHELEKDNKEIIIYYDSNISEGLIGIIASRLKDFYNKPSIVITNSNNILKGSARSINQYNIGKAIKRLKNKKLLLNGGGHNMAAGFSLKKENLNKFKELIKNDYIKKNNTLTNELFYDSEVSPSVFNRNFYNDIKKLEPFGNGNLLPIFLLRDLRIIKSIILKKKHISCLLTSSSNITINSIAFNSVDSEIGKYLLNYKKKINVIGQINENNWNNKKTLQLIIKDLIL